jgi:hypothetical protein
VKSSAVYNSPSAFHSEAQRAGSLIATIDYRESKSWYIRESEMALDQLPEWRKSVANGALTDRTD